MSARQYVESMGYEIMRQVMDRVGRDGAPLERWQELAGINTTYNKHVPEFTMLVDTGRWDPKVITRNILRQFTLEHHVEIVPHNRNHWRPVIDQGRTVTGQHERYRQLVPSIGMLANSAPRSTVKGACMPSISGSSSRLVMEGMGRR